MPFATFTVVSKPTTSDNRNVPDLGLPEISPVSLSTSSMVRPNSSVALITLIMAYTPTRLAMNAGVSLHKTVVLPR